MLACVLVILALMSNRLQASCDSVPAVHGTQCAPEAEIAIAVLKFFWVYSIGVGTHGLWTPFAVESG